MHHNMTRCFKVCENDDVFAIRPIAERVDACVRFDWSAQLPATHEVDCFQPSSPAMTLTPLQEQLNAPTAASLRSHHSPQYSETRFASHTVLQIDDSTRCKPSLIAPHLNRHIRANRLADLSQKPLCLSSFQESSYTSYAFKNAVSPEVTARCSLK